MADFHLLITEWYRQNARDLPWRNTTNPYFIWLSETILQQTRVDQGRSYYEKFTKNYPTIKDLADADEQQVLKDWQGLGYYSRARNLHATSKRLLTEFNGEFPENYEEIRSLKGVGDYTAAAISSFAFNLPHAVVDGNVYRVLSRYFDIESPVDSHAGKKYFQSLAQELINKKDPATHNQAIMELGAMICKPTHPLCTHCPLHGSCQALQNNTINLRPQKSKKTKVRNRYFTFLVFTNEKQTIIQKREDKDVWKHLYQFPMIESETHFNDSEINDFLQIKPIYKSAEMIHVLSHQRIHATFYHFDRFPPEFHSNWLVVETAKIDDYPLPRLIDKYLQENPLV